MDSAPYGFRIVGDCRNERRVVDWLAAFRGYAACDGRAEVNREAYLSAFTFGSEFCRQLELSGSTRGYKGVCCASSLPWDIDRDGDLECATRDARHLAAFLVDRYGLDDDELSIDFSGSKGFHVGLPTSLWKPQPSAGFNETARQFAEYIAEQVGIKIDTSIYDKVRPFRAPNSRHPKTGLHKRRLAFDELLYLRTDAIVKLAVEPAPFDIPDPPASNDRAVADWQEAVEQVQHKATVAKQCRANGSTRLNRITLEIIRDGTVMGTPEQNGDRHRLLFSAAANLAECGCPPALAHALLTESGLDSGLPPKEVHRQIDCGLAHNRSTMEGANDE